MYKLAVNQEEGVFKVAVGIFEYSLFELIFELIEKKTKTMTRISKLMI